MPKSGTRIAAAAALGILITFSTAACSDHSESNPASGATQPTAKQSASGSPSEGKPGYTAKAPVKNQDPKIEALIQKIAAMDDAVFVRNGKDYSAKDAAEFLRYKLIKYQAQVNTADDFIRVVASKSNTTGEVYHIRLKDGTTMESAEFLRKELAVLNTH